MLRALAWLFSAVAVVAAHQELDAGNGTVPGEGPGSRVKRAWPAAGLGAGSLQQLPGDEGRSRRQEPHFVPEPSWVLLDRRETLGPVRQAALLPGLADPFWVARGRRREMTSSSASSEEPFWAARGRREQELFWPARGKRQQEEEARWSVAEDTGLDGQWSARDRRATLRDYLASLSSRQYFVPARGKRVSEAEDGLQAAAGVEKRSADDGRTVRRRLAPGSGSAEEPFWAARGRRGRLLRTSSASAEEPFWAARGRRAGAASTSAEGPFWAARGRSLTAQPAFWPARGRRAAAHDRDNVDSVEEDADEADNAEDRSFWDILHQKEQEKVRQ